MLYEVARQSQPDWQPEQLTNQFYSGRRLYSVHLYTTCLPGRATLVTYNTFSHNHTWMVVASFPANEGKGARGVKWQERECWMPVEAAMAVCRRTRVLKLVVLLLLSLGLLYQFFPDQMRDILEQFAPPNHEPESKESERRVAEQNKILRRPRNEHVPYLTPGMLLRHVQSAQFYPR